MKPLTKEEGRQLNKLVEEHWSTIISICTPSLFELMECSREEIDKAIDERSILVAERLTEIMREQNEGDQAAQVPES
jgi:hypothetical protein